MNQTKIGDNGLKGQKEITVNQKFDRRKVKLLKHLSFISSNKIKKNPPLQDSFTLFRTGHDISSIETVKIYES